MVIYQITSDSRFLCFQLKFQIIPMKLCPGQPFPVIFLNSDIWHRRSIIYPYLLAYFIPSLAYALPIWTIIYKFEMYNLCFFIHQLGESSEDTFDLVQTSFYPISKNILGNILQVQKLWLILCQICRHFIIRDKLNVIKTEYFYNTYNTYSIRFL